MILISRKKKSILIKILLGRNYIYWFFPSIYSLFIVMIFFFSILIITRNNDATGKHFFLYWNFSVELSFQNRSFIVHRPWRICFSQCTKSDSFHLGSPAVGRVFSKPSRTWLAARNLGHLLFDEQMWIFWTFQVEMYR